MEFTTYTLGEVCTRLSSGKSIKASEVFEFGKYPVYGGNGLRGYSDKSNFNGSCAIIGRQGAYCGNVRYFEGEGYMTEHAVVCQANEKADNYYLSALLSTMHLERLSGQSAQPGLAVGTLSVQPIPLPPLSVQRRIAAILSSLDRKIELNNKINAQLEEMAQTLFKHWLMSCSEELTIGDLAYNITDYTKCDKPEVVLINSSDVTEGFFDHHTHSPNSNLKGHFKKRFQNGDILYSQVRPRNRHWAYCDFNSEEYLASTQLMVIRNRPEIITSLMLYQYLKSEDVWKEFTLKTETRSGTFPQGNYEDLSAIKVPFGAKMDSISKTIDSVYKQCYSLNRENLHLSQLRDTLLPKLMSGEIEL